MSASAITTGTVGSIYMIPLSAELTNALARVSISITRGVPTDPAVLYRRVPEGPKRM
jgi:hypothetical protein